MIIQVGGEIGALNTIGLLILIAIVGSWLIKHEGIKVWNRFVQQVQAGKEPLREIADGVCVLVAGACCSAPGFISDVLALLLLFPPTRALARRWLLKRKGLATTRVIRASYGGRVTNVTRVTDVTETTATEIKGELDP